MTSDGGVFSCAIGYVGWLSVLTSVDDTSSTGGGVSTLISDAVYGCVGCVFSWAVCGFSAGVEEGGFSDITLECSVN